VLEAWRGEDVHLKKLETFSRLRKLSNVLEAWRGEDVHLKKLETFSRLRKLPNPGFTGEGFFENQPHNSLQRGIEPEWSRPHLSSPSQLAACSFGWWLMAGAGLF
jgi:hypothetical protein